MSRGEREMNELLARWPGKSPVIVGGAPHPAPYHFLDVAAVAERLIASWSLEPPVGDALILLAALHDLGKIGAPFKAMLERGQPQAAGSHWEVTEAYLRAFDADILARRLGGSDLYRYELYAAAAGHHGRPPDKDLSFGRRGAEPRGDWRRMLDAAGAQGLADAAEITREFLDLWPLAAIDAVSSLADARLLSWRAAGLTTAADWIASNVDWFPPVAPGPRLGEYLEQARLRAKSAVAQAGLATPAARGGPMYEFELRPMQVACGTAALPEGPMLAILEDETGSGKTEAALILAARMLMAGKGRGLYVALPTMATADAMFNRVALDVLRIYERAPSLALAHGRARLSELYRELRDGRRENPDEPGADDWLADNRRRALLADVGVGTIDQALLAVLKAKHSALRLFGLSSKILIVDEVHEMGDPYLGELVATLLETHAAQGGSAILLSATLPLALRAMLVAAFERGAGRAPLPPTEPSYPALTISGSTPSAIVAGPSARGPVRVRRLDDSEAAVDLLAKAAREGAACVFVRNSVDEAIAALGALRERGVSADLLHARFALCDRKRHEEEALKTFGKGRKVRLHRVLVATQVVESSLDLDFDVMVSDLAPMAALIQRAGRLWRHMALRPAATRPVESPTLHVLSPDPHAVGEENWLQTTIGGGAFVYPVALQWRTAKVLFDAGRIEAPGGLRDLIEAAHGEEIALPDALLRAEFTAAGKAGAERSHAMHNRIDWAEGYRAGARGADDADYPTRLGERQQTLVLARRVENGLIPWAGGGWSVDACQLSEVQANWRRLQALDLPDQNTPEIAAIRSGLPAWLRESRTICPVADSGHITRELRYLPDFGLLIESRARGDGPCLSASSQSGP